MSIDLEKGVTVVGEFPDHERAKAAPARVQAAGFAADDVAITDDPRRAREAAGSRSPALAAIGAVLGAALGAFFVIGVGSSYGWAVVPMYAVVGAAIGWLAGRARVFKAREFTKLEDAAEGGSAIVTVSAGEDAVRRAEQALRDAGAMRVRIERTGEKV